MTKSKKRIASQRASKKEKIRDKRIGNALIVLMVFFLIHHLFFEGFRIGYDRRYTLYIVLLPIIVGSMIMSVFYFKSYKKDLADIKSIAGKILISGFYLLIVVFGGYFFFAQFVGETWNYFNKEAAAKNPQETFYANVDQFSVGKNCYIYFKFQNRTESINLRYKDIKMYESVSPNRYQIALTAQKGIWNYYVVKHWEIIDKEDTLMNTIQ